eukprot:1277273-Amphidinium_carterae.1
MSWGMDSLDVGYGCGHFVAVGVCLGESMYVSETEFSNSSLLQRFALRLTNLVGCQRSDIETRSNLHT